jgi:uncharacterized phiE125 gp8 family phage protein
MIPLMLMELTSVPGAALPVDELARHLRLSRGFADDGDLDGHLEACLRAALAAIEARIGKALYRRRFSLSVAAWSADDRHVLPVAPATAVESLKVFSRTGEEAVIDPAGYVLYADPHRPAVLSVASRMPSLPMGGTAEIVFEAGFAADWPDLPPDLRQAVLLLASEFFGQDVQPEVGLPLSVAVLIEPFRALRLGGGRG